MSAFAPSGPRARGREVDHEVPPWEKPGGPRARGREPWRSTVVHEPRFAAGMNRTVSERIPVTLIGGYLGAGKTSLLNHLLTHAGGERITVLVNDFGALGLDAALVARRDADTVTLTNGCVCCSIADDFGAALDAQVRAREPPERIVVETSGVAEPAKTARYAGGLARRPARCGSHGGRSGDDPRCRAKDRFVGDLVLRQIGSADLIVANKSDRVEAPARRSDRGSGLLATHLGAALVETSHGRVAPAVVLGIDNARLGRSAVPEPRNRRTAFPQSRTSPRVIHGRDARRRASRRNPRNSCRDRRRCLTRHSSG